MTTSADQRLLPATSADTILPRYRDTAVASFLLAHNLNDATGPDDNPRLIICTCMDHRVRLRLPHEFAFVLRSASASIEPLLFNIGCAIALRPIEAIAIVGHTDCAMTDVDRHRASFVQTMTTDGSLSEADAGAMFDRGAATFGCADPVAHTLSQCAIAEQYFPRAIIAPLHYDVTTGSIWQVRT